ncbi:hypothetical protein H6F78_17525 [Coleofasciculus sp. FACHB-64]|nr:MULTISPECIES: hypothetical protein [unclassified Coleofasciculus]MBD2047373.1 hypothetical protein [Coleofasciculus sp. FACHB-64]MBD2086148.1 hypothetical protein [Coleofasciculus sp. FACHB-542]
MAAALVAKSGTLWCFGCGIERATTFTCCNDSVKYGDAEVMEVVENPVL